MARLGVDWWLLRLASGDPALLPAADWNRVPFADTLDLHLLMDFKELAARKE